MLLIYTDTKKKHLLNKVFKPALKPNNIPHRVVPVSKEDGIPLATEGEVLLVLGNTGLGMLQKQGVIPKKRTIGSLRGRLFPFGGGFVMVSYDPSLMEVAPEREPEIHWDARLVARLMHTGSLDPVLGDYSYVGSFGDALKTIMNIYQKTGKKVPVSLDLETIGFDPWAKTSSAGYDARIISVAISYKVGHSLVYYVSPNGKLRDTVLNQLTEVCTSPHIKLVGANLKFDYRWLKQHWDIEITNQTFDTFLVGSLLNENIKNSLNLHAKMHTSIGGYDDAFNTKFDKGRMDLIPKSDLLPYAAGDTDACLRVFHVQRSELINNKRLAYFYTKLVQPAANVFSKMEHRGVIVDQKRYLELKEEVTNKVNELSKLGISLLPRTMQIKYRDDLKLTRPKILREFMFSKHGLNLEPQVVTEKTQQPSTALDHLAMFSDHPDAKAFIAVLKEHSSAKKTLSTYIVGFMKHIRSDGRFHPSYILGRSDFGGVVTGRTSCKDPAWQTNPKHTVWAKPLRTVYTCPPGYVILKGDYSQGELRVTACVAQEKTMIQTYHDGIDIHLKTGAQLTGYELSEAMKMLESPDNKIKKLIKKIRQGGKAGNFGLIYRISAAGLVEYARNTYGVILTLSEAEEFKSQFFTLYPRLEQWHSEAISFAKNNGYVVSPLGRYRHLPLINSYNSQVRSSAERMAINSPIQGTLSDMCQLAMIELDKRYPDLWMFGFTHDEIQFYVPENEEQLWAGRIKEVMENLPVQQFGWHPEVNFEVDFDYSAVNLAECSELQLI